MNDQIAVLHTCAGKILGSVINPENNILDLVQLIVGASYVKEATAAGILAQRLLLLHQHKGHIYCVLNSSTGGVLLGQVLQQQIGCHTTCERRMFIAAGILLIGMGFVIKNLVLVGLYLALVWMVLNRSHFQQAAMHWQLKGSHFQQAAAY